MKKELKKLAASYGNNAVILLVGLAMLLVSFDPSTLVWIKLVNTAIFIVVALIELEAISRELEKDVVIALTELEAIKRDIGK